MTPDDLLALINQQAAVQALGLQLKPEQCHITLHHLSETALQATIEWCFSAHSLTQALQNSLRQALHQQGFRDCQLHFKQNIRQYQTQHGLAPRQGVKNILAIASGKGGVGKSTVTTNLALALQAQGAKVGILDADIYGPSQPHMLGGLVSPESKDEKTLEPVDRYGLQVMSIGYLIDTETAMIWRGPMVSTALQQLFNDTQWHELDYLLIDLPPGTGDIQLTLSQKIPVAGAVIVTTPQDIALLDVTRAVAMFQKVQVPILGVIENMSYHECSQCGHHEALFGAGGGDKMAQQFDLPLLAQLPLSLKIRQDLDQGQPTVVADPTHPLAQQYRDLAIRVSAQLALSNVKTQSRFPKIVIES